ncbi:S-adenosyl-L-methionine-dependent methyltransferase [Mycena floridula]|nr:S-adenosyl-L-methionine-dependent methyltransferase [Mycena floridula]
MTTVHKVAQTGFGIGNELYDRARPSYQPAALQHIRQAVKATTPLNIVELGAGTGIFTRALLAHPDWSSSVKELRAVEPSQGMRQVFTESIKDERVSISEGTFVTTGIVEGWADIVIVAQAFHWSHPEYGRAAEELARILKPNGIAALIWNLEDRNAAKWVGQLRTRIEKHEGDSPQFRLGLWRKTFDTDSYKQSFSPPEEKTWVYTLPTTADIAVERANSKSYITSLPEDVQTKVLDDVKAIVQRGDGLVWIDESQGIFEYPYQTLVVIAQKK